MIVHLIFNTIIVFLWLLIVIEVALYFLNIKNARICYICRSLPFLKIPFDFLTFLFIGDSLFINLNPFSCEVFVQDLIGKLFYYNPLTEVKHIVIPQYLASFIPPLWLAYLNVAIILITICGITYKLYQLYLSNKYVRNIIKNSIPFDKTIDHPKIQNHLTQFKVKIRISDEIDIPFASGFSSLILPKNKINELTTEELNAIIAHELQHLRWQDPLLKFIFSLISSVCWWLPAKKWLFNRLIDHQEQASDAAIQTYSIDPLALASGIKKIIKKGNLKQRNALVCLLTESHLNRVRLLLNPEEFFLKNAFHKNCFLATAISLGLFMCLWMC